MLVNKLKKPPTYEQWEHHHNKSNIAHNEKCLAWQEAEKKVIFVDTAHQKELYFERYSFGNGKNIITVDETNRLEDWTLHDLAEATNGELETKNIEI